MMTIFNPLKYITSKKVGLALGSGGAKGLSHISVIKYLQSMGIPIDKIAGSSIGAIVGACYACGTLEKLKKDALSISKKELLSLFDITFPRSGLLKGDDFIRFMGRYIPADAMIEDMPIDLSILATDFYSGKSVIFRRGPIIDALRASVSIPGVFVPVPFKKTFLIDGGVANPLPLETVKMMGADLTIAVNLHPGLKTSKLDRFLETKLSKKGFYLYSDDNYFSGEINLDAKGQAAVVEPEADSSFLSLEKWLGSKKKEDVDFPNIFEVLLQSIDIMEIANTRNILVYNKPTVLIEPKLLNVGTLDFDSVYEVITEGYKACSEVSGKLRRRIKIWV